MYEMEGPHQPSCAARRSLGEPALPGRPPAENTYLSCQFPDRCGFRGLPRIGIRRQRWGSSTAREQPAQEVSASRFVILVEIHGRPQDDPRYPQK